MHKYWQTKYSLC